MSRRRASRSSRTLAHRDDRAGGRNQTAAGKLDAQAAQLSHLRELIVYSAAVLPDQTVMRRLPNLRWG